MIGERLVREMKGSLLKVCEERDRSYFMRAACMDMILCFGGGIDGVCGWNRDQVDSMNVIS